MPDSIPKKILLALTQRLEKILIADGYNTDAGLNVYRGRTSFDVNDPSLLPALSVFDESEEAGPPHDERNDETLTVAIVGHALVDPYFPADGAHDLIADIKQAALVYTDKTLGHLATIMEYAGRETKFPDDAGNVVTVTVVLKIQYPEKYGDPYTILL